MRIKTTARHAQHELPLHFVAGTYTARAVDTFRHVRLHVRVAQVFWTVQVVFTLGVTHVADTHLRGYSLQFAVVVHFTGQAV